MLGTALKRIDETKKKEDAHQLFFCSMELDLEIERGPRDTQLENGKAGVALLRYKHRVRRWLASCASLASTGASRCSTRSNIGSIAKNHGDALRCLSESRFREPGSFRGRTALPNDSSRKRTKLAKVFPLPVLACSAEAETLIALGLAEPASMWLIFALNDLPSGGEMHLSN
ncbi:hypothetical protein BDZ45DRAFT_691668 [Acephala macrosclerotiorum]|nr:hypothetical protein BDZ45DRAFT_691668 [Acephala macrosclerotiorum]